MTSEERVLEGASANEDAIVLVVVGAGAGCIPPLRLMLRAMPKTGRVSILVLAPRTALDPSDVESSALPVGVAENGARFTSGRVYIVPPDRDAEISNGRLLLRPLADDVAPIDRVFRSVSSAYGSACACVVLSGSGADGASGLKRVKEGGGLTVAQAPSEAAFDGMPRNAVATGLVDLILPASEIGARVATVTNLLPVITAAEDEPTDRSVDPLREILTLVRVR